MTRPFARQRCPAAEHHEFIPVRDGSRVTICIWCEGVRFAAEPWEIITEQRLEPGAEAGSA